MFDEGDSLCLEASVIAAPRGELRDLAASVILQGLYDLSSNDWRARQSAVHFIRRDGGGIWADYLELDRDLIRKANRPTRSRGGRMRRNSGADALDHVLSAGGDSTASVKMLCRGLDNAARVESGTTEHELDGAKFGGGAQS